MKKINLYFLVISILLFISCVGQKLNDGLYAKINTNYGSFTVELYYDKVPVTVGNFVGLAKGLIEWTDVNGVKQKKPFYNGLIFHRVVKDFVIQGGDPTGTGYGGPGYRFLDEFDISLRHDSEGILSMANAGPDTNGSQFFITLAPIPHLDGKHAVFGKVVSGMDVVKKIGEVKVDGREKPYKTVYIKSIDIIAIGEKALKFDPVQAFDMRFELEKKREEELKVKMKDFLKELGCKEESKVKMASGLEYYILKNGSGKVVKAGDLIKVHYTGYLANGKKFDSSYDRNTPFVLNIGVGRVIKGWDEGVVGMKVGEKRVLVIPYYMGYGESGSGPIPPKATMIFEVELLGIESK